MQQVIATNPFNPEKLAIYLPAPHSLYICNVLQSIVGQFPLKYTMTSSNGNIFRVTGHLYGNSPVAGEFPAQRPVTRSFDVFFDLCLNKWLSKQSWGWWFETLSRHYDIIVMNHNRFSIHVVRPCSSYPSWTTRKDLNYMHLRHPVQKM